MINNIIKFTTVYSDIHGNTKKFDLKEPYKDIEYLLKKRNRVFFISPRQSGKTMFLSHTILQNIGKYEQIIILSAKQSCSEEINIRVRYNLEFYNLNSQCSIYTKDRIVINGTEIITTFNLNNITIKDKVLIVYDEFIFDLNFNTKLDTISMLSNKERQIDIIGGSSKANNTNYTQLLTKELLDGNYDIYPIYFGDVFTVDKLKYIIDNYPDSIINEYV